MIELSRIESIYLWTGYIDMRKGFNGLIALAESIVPHESIGHRLFIFCMLNFNHPARNEKNHLTAEACSATMVK